jgi:hypothetical protein
MLGATMTFQVLNETKQSIEVRNPPQLPGVDTFTNYRSLFFLPQSLPVAARTYDDEKEAFRSLRMMLQSRYPGEYIAIAGGAVYGHDRSRLRLAQRFFAERGQGPVYIGFAGPRPVIRIPTPFIRRR